MRGLSLDVICCLGKNMHDLSEAGCIHLQEEGKGTYSEIEMFRNIRPSEV
jgi:hypothetical protein